jgi:hypothetical protein
VVGVTTFRLATPWEARPVLCGARRGGPRSRVWCTIPALHHHLPFHAGRGRDGRWFVWGTR